MTTWLRAIQYRNLDQARTVLETVAGSEQASATLTSSGNEPDGLLTVVPEDRLAEKLFYRLLDAKKGFLVQVEKIPYAGYGPPARETEYMGFPDEQVAYVLEGGRFSIGIRSCPQGARDLHHLEAMILDGRHPLERNRVATRLDLPNDWDFEDLMERIADGVLSGDEIDRIIHESSE